MAASVFQRRGVYAALDCSLLVRTVAAAVKRSALSIPVGFEEAGVETAWNAVAEAAHPRLYVEAPLSAVQMEFVCNKKPEGLSR